MKYKRHLAPKTSVEGTLILHALRPRTKVRDHFENTDVSKAIYKYSHNVAVRPIKSISDLADVVLRFDKYIKKPLPIWSVASTLTVESRSVEHLQVSRTMKSKFQLQWHTRLSLVEVLSEQIKQS